MDDPSASTPLMVSVAPSSSSFFAGEHFSCIITFTNTRIALPSTQPLPSTSAFGSVSGKGNSNKNNNHNSSDSSLSDAASLAAAQRRVFSSAPALGRSSHAKSQSVDVRTFARQLQLEGADEGARDEGYYRARRLALAAESVDSLESQHASSQQDSANIPSRRRLIGQDRHATSQRHASDAFSAAQALSQNAGPAPWAKAPPHLSAHKHAASMYATPDHSSRAKGHTGLGLGLPGPSTRAPFASPDPSGATPTRPTLNLIHPSGGSSVGSPTPQRMASGAFRQPSGPVPRTHPHGRKQSIAAVQAEDLSAAFALGGSAASPITEEEPASPSLSNGPSTPRALPNGHSFYQAGQGANDTMESVLRDDISAWSRPGAVPGASGQGGGNSSALDPSTPTSTTSSSVNTPYGAPKSSPLFPSERSYAPGTVSLLWSFAQFGGEFKVDESLIKPGEFERVKKRLAMDRTIGGGHLSSPFGGKSGWSQGSGEMGASQLGGSEEDAQQDGWASYLSSALFFRPARRGHGRSVSSIGDRQTRTMQNRAVPLFSCPPSILAVDLDLKPGESRSYSFRIPLPADLPPSYTGRAISFTYTLTLGTNRVDHAVPRSAGPNGRFSQKQSSKQEQRSRLIRIPLRIYNHVSVSGATHFFDLTNPVVYRRDESVVREETDEFSGTPTIASPPGVRGPRRDSAVERSRAKAQGREEVFGKSEFEVYARDLLRSTRGDEAALEEEDAPTDVEAAVSAAALAARDLLSAPDPTSSPPSMRRSLSRSSSMNLPRPTSPLGRRASVAASAAGEEDDGPKTSMEAVEHLSRNSQKVSYDISKDGQIVAVLTLIKSKYRLGDTVSGVVTMNKSGSVARVVRIAATLESHEAIQPDLSTLPQNRVARMTKVLHSECHQSTLNAGQASFALPIPSGATPDFVTSAVKINWTVRLSFLTLACVRPVKGGPRGAPPAHLIPVESDGYEHFHQSLVAVPHLSGPLHPSIGSTISSNAASADAQGEAQEDAQVPEAQRSVVRQPASLPEGTKLEVVECAVPLNVLPHSTRFQPGAASVFL